MKPYENTDADGDYLPVAEHEGRPGCALVHTRHSTSVPASEVPVLALALYEAAGLPEPLILENLPACEAPRTAVRPIVRAGFKVWRDHRGVHLTEVIPHEHDPERHWIDPAHALDLAAVIAVLAGRDEADPAEVERLPGPMKGGGGGPRF